MQREREAAEAQLQMQLLVAEAARQAQAEEKLRQTAQSAAREAHRKAEEKKKKEQIRAERAAERERRALVWVTCHCGRQWRLSEAFCAECGSALEGCVECSPPVILSPQAAVDPQQEAEKKEAKQEEKKAEKRAKMERDLEAVFDRERGEVRQVLEEHAWNLEASTQALLDRQRKEEEKTRTIEADRKAREHAAQTPTRAKVTPVTLPVFFFFLFAYFFFV